jgi:hypothetical protein
MNIRIALVAGMVGSLFATSAFAEEGVASSTAVEKKFKLGAQLELVPVGKAEVKLGGESASADADTAYAVGMNFDYDVTPYISIGLAPRLIFGLKSEKSTSDSTDEEINLRARVMGHFPVTGQMQIFGYAAPGYAISVSDADKDPSGFLIAFGGGATYDVTPSLFLSGELGYQMSFQSVTDTVPGAGEVTLDVNTSFLSVGIGAGTRF